MSPLRLHDLHASHGASFGEVSGSEVVLGFGPLESGYAAARSAAVLIDLSYREWIRLVGEDRISFLQGMVTNDVAALKDGETLYAAQLTNKGAMVADARVWRRPQELLLDTEPGQGEKLRAALDKFLISEDAELQDATGDLALLGLYGPRAPELLGALGLATPPPPGKFVSLAVDGVGVEATGTDSYGVPGVELRIPAGSLEQVYARLLQAGQPVGLLEAGFELLEVLRVEAGTPRYGADMDEKTIPLEANLERALHYKKGCNIGQEVIARATFRGHMNRKLVGLTLQAQPPVARAELRVADRKVGWLTTVVRSPTRGLIALGYVHRDFLAPGTSLSVADQDQQVLVAPLPFQ